MATEPKYTFEVESRFTASPETWAAMRSGHDLMQATIDNMIRTFSGAVDRAAMMLLDAGCEGVVAWSEAGGHTVTLTVDDKAAVAVAGSFVMDDGRMLFNVETTWHPPFEGLAKERDDNARRL
jgi:hypothetical protein